MLYSGYIDSGRIRRSDDTQKGPIMADTQSIIITNPDGVAFTLHGVPNGATLQLLPTEPTVPTVPTVAEPIAEPTVAEPTVDVVDDAEPTPPTTVGPKGLNRADRKRTQSKPKAKAKVTQSDKPDPIKSTAPRSPLQQAGNAKGRHDKYGSTKTATEWLALAIAAVDALSDPQSKAEERKLATATERHAACLAQLRSEGYVPKNGRKVKA